MKDFISSHHLLKQNKKIRWQSKKYTNSFRFLNKKELIQNKLNFPYSKKILNHFLINYHRVLSIQMNKMKNHKQLIIIII